MIEEIIYTSAPKGLRAGSHGFCTVVSTAGMAANMAERLESMSGYRHAFPLNDPNNALNPVNFAHVTTRMAGQKRHVISRVSDAGQDYSGRTNKLAHHVALESVLSFTAGPARLLAGDLLTVVWDGKVETRPARSIGNPEVPSKIRLDAWKSATGDGGWAGLVTEKLLASKAPVNVIFEAGTATLPLVVEVLDLVPISQRWGITFSTYFTRLLAGTECQLRFYLNGTSEATTIRNDARAMTVDLTKSLPAADGGSLVEKARSGVIEYVAPVVRTVESGRKTISDAELTNFLGEERAGDAATVSRHESSMTFGSDSQNTQFANTFGGRKKQLPIAVIAAVAVALVVGAGFGAYLISQPAKRRQEIAGNGQGQAVAPVNLVEVDRTEDGQQPETVQSGQEASVTPPVTVVTSPFGDRKPFDSIREIYDRRSGAFVWQLPKPADPTDSTAAEIFVGRATDVVASTSESTLILDEVDIGDVREWRVAVGSQRLGTFALRARADDQPALLDWTWDQAIVSPTELDSSLAVALRTLRNARIKFSSGQQIDPYPQPADRLNVQLAGDTWPRFSHLGTGADNRGLTLGVPDPGAISDDGNLLKTSESLLLDAESPGDITLTVINECNSLIADHDAYLAKAIGGTKSNVTWNLGLKPKGGDSKDGEAFGRYSITKADAQGLVKLQFEWLPNVDGEFAAALQWMPVEVSIGGQSHVLFPRGPQRFRSQELLDLGQGDVCEFPGGFQSAIPLRFPDQNVHVNFEVKIQTKAGPVKCLLRATRENPTPEMDLGHFDLVTPLALQAKPGSSAGVLGDALLKASPSKAEANVIPSTVRLRTVAGFNRSNLFHLNSVHLVNVFDPRYWTEKGKFLRQPFQNSATEMLAHVAKFSQPLNPRLRHPEDRLARYGKLKDSFNRIETHLSESVVELERLLTFTEVDLRPAYPRMPSSLLKQRSDPQVKALLQRQFDAISEIRNAYTDDQWKQDTDTIRLLQEELSQLVADVDISLEVQRANGESLRLYFVSTSRKAGAK